MSNLSQRLKDRGIKAKDLAVRAGVSPSYLSMLLKGQRANPSASAISRIVAASDGAFSPSDFMPEGEAAA